MTQHRRHILGHESSRNLAGLDGMGLAVSDATASQCHSLLLRDSCWWWFKAPPSRFTRIQIVQVAYPNAQHASDVRTSWHASKQGLIKIAKRDPSIVERAKQTKKRGYSQDTREQALAMAANVASMIAVVFAIFRRLPNSHLLAVLATREGLL